VYEQNLEKVQAIMNENIEKCALKSIDQLADALDTTNPGEGSDEMDQDHEERVERGINANIGIYEGKGENKVIINKKSMRKQKHGISYEGDCQRNKNLQSTPSGNVGETETSLPLFFLVSRITVLEQSFRPSFSGNV
jgi:hypothetical protein